MCVSPSHVLFAGDEQRVTWSDLHGAGSAKRRYTIPWSTLSQGLKEAWCSEVPRMRGTCRERLHRPCRGLRREEQEGPVPGALRRVAGAMWRPPNVAGADFRNPEPHGASVFAKALGHFKEHVRCAFSTDLLWRQSGVERLAQCAHPTPWPKGLLQPQGHSNGLYHRHKARKWQEAKSGGGHQGQGE